MKQHYVQQAYIDLFLQPTPKGNRLFIYQKSEQRWRKPQPQSGANLLQMVDWQSVNEEIADGEVERKSIPVIKQLSQWKTQLSQDDAKLIIQWIALHENRKKRDLEHFSKNLNGITHGRQAFKTLDTLLLENMVVTVETSETELIMPDCVTVQISVVGETCIMFAAGPRTLVSLLPKSRCGQKISHTLPAGRFFNALTSKFSKDFYIAPAETVYYERLPHEMHEIFLTEHHQVAITGTLDGTVGTFMKMQYPIR